MEEQATKIHDVSGECPLWLALPAKRRPSNQGPQSKRGFTDQISPADKSDPRPEGQPSLFRLDRASIKL
jgi:hypothetical protein